MTDQTTMPPEAALVTHRVKRLPPDVLRWLLLLRGYPSTPEMVTGLEVADDEFALVVVTRQSWNIISEQLNAPHRDKWRASYQDAGAPAQEVIDRAD